MNYKCTTKKEGFKNLTVNKNYDGVEQGDNILVTADNGTPQKYNKKYFQRVAQTLEEILDQFLTLRITQDGNALNVVYTHGTNRSVTELGMGRSRISCGLTEMWNINDILDIIREIVFEYGSNTITESTVSIQIWERIVSHLRRNKTDVVFLMCSDAIEPDEEDYYDGLDALTIDITEGLNTNSNNEIRIWVIRVHE